MRSPIVGPVVEVVNSYQNHDSGTRFLTVFKATMLHVDDSY
jgi:hypothetical protein